jgi:FKBP-type peptidyl-prolyl cis-trans isomerase (trigger factor)
MMTKLSKEAVENLECFEVVGSKKASRSDSELIQEIVELSPKLASEDPDEWSAALTRMMNLLSKLRQRRWEEYRVAYNKRSERLILGRGVQ